jgi:hypothetical protein
VQLPVGSRWTDSQGQQFKINSVDDNGDETWVTYTRVKDDTDYRCLAEAFTCRFLRIENDSRS